MCGRGVGNCATVTNDPLLYGKDGYGCSSMCVSFSTDGVAQLYPGFFGAVSPGQTNVLAKWGGVTLECTCYIT